MFQKLKKLKLDYEQIIYFLLFLLFLTLTLIFTYIRYPNWINSDMSAEIIAAKQAIQEGGILSRNWYYGTELRIITPILIYEFLLLFTNNFFVIRAVTIPIVLIILLLSLYFLSRQLGYKKYFFLIAAIFLLPFSLSSSYFVYVVSGYQMYSFYICLMFISIGLYFLYKKQKDNRNKIIIISLLSIIGILLGLNGIRQMLIFYIPFFLVILLITLLNTKEYVFKIAQDQNKLIIPSIMILANGLGIILYYSVMKRFFNTSSISISIAWPSINSIKDSFNNLFSCLGLCSGNDVFSVFSNITFAFSIIGIILFLVLFIKNFKDYDPNEKILILFSYISIFILFCFFLFITMTLNNYELKFSQYYICNFTFFIFIIPIFLSKNYLKKIKLKNKERIIKYSFVSLFTLVASFSFSCYYGKSIMQEKINNDIFKIAEIVEKNNFSFGYARHWNGAVVTELTNFKIDMYVFNIVEEKVEINREVQDRKHEEFIRDERCFVIFDNIDMLYKPYKNCSIYGKTLFVNELILFEIPTAKILNL